jgi:hypothetical protein
MKAFEKPRYWIAGSCLALFGVLVARVIPGVLGDSLRPWVGTAGILCAFAGLFIITLGTRRKIIIRQD